MGDNLKLKQNNKISLRNYNTFKIDVGAKKFVKIQHIDELIEFLDGHDEDDKILVMGGGSNVLFVDDFDGIILKMEILGIEEVGEDESSVIIKANAGEEWDDLVEYCVQRGLGGIENLSNIPGSVGAAPIQNIGAYGVELKDVFVELEAIEITSGHIRIFKNEDCDFAYRNSIFKGKLKGQYIIISVTLKLNKVPQFILNYGGLAGQFEHDQEIGLRDVRETIINIRNQKLPDPSKYGCAGSFFKNPEVSREIATRLLKEYPDLRAFPTEDGRMKIPAGWLIEKCGFKGYRKGDAGVYDKHALILVNYDHATGKEIFNLANKIRAQVRDRFNIELEFEVNVIRK